MGTFDSSLDVRCGRGDNDYEMRQCDGCHQVKKNLRMKETIARAISQCYGDEATCPEFTFDVEGGLPALTAKDCLFCAKLGRTYLENGRQVLRLDRIEAGWVSEMMS